jgi:hypothetical protein
MLCFTRLLFVLSCFLLTLSVFSFETRAQDRTTIDQAVTFKRGASSAVIKKQVRKGTSHQYRIRAREGQNMTVILTTGKRTSFTVYAPTEGIIEGADGETMWRGMLNETGKYLIVIGTDVTANYTLEIHIKN